MLLQFKCEKKKSGLIQICVWKRGTFSYNCGYSLKPHPKQTSSSVLGLAARWNLKCLSGLLLSCANPLASLAIGMALSPVAMHNFKTSCIDNLENTGSLGSRDLLNVDPFHDTISKSPHSFTSAPISPEKP